MANVKVVITKSNSDPTAWIAPHTAIGSAHSLFATENLAFFILKNVLNFPGILHWPLLVSDMEKVKEKKEGKDSVHHKMARRDGCVQGGVQGALHQKIAQ